MTSWFEQVSDAPRSFCDPASVAKLLVAALDTDAEEDERNAAAGALCRVVKVLELEPVEASGRLIVERLPDLAARLLHPDPYYTGQMLSVLRRFEPDARTVARILTLLSETSVPERETLVVALGLADRAAWSDDAEVAVVRELADPVCAGAAAGVCFSHVAQIARSETVGALAAATPRLPRVMDRGLALGALTLLSRGPLAAAAAAAVRALAAAWPNLRPEIADAQALYGRG